MRFYYSKNSSAIIVGSIEELNALHSSLERFLCSEETLYFLKTDVSGSPQPYEDLLNGIEFIKSSGPILAKITDDKIFQITGSPENLKIYCNYFSFKEDEEGEHHHPEHVRKEGYMSPGTMSLIIEADYAA